MLEKRKGRDKYIVLTERGEKLIKEKIIPIMEMEERTFLEMGEEERKEMLRLNEKYVEVFRKNVGGLEKYEDTVV